MDGRIFGNNCRREISETNRVGLDDSEVGVAQDDPASGQICCFSRPGGGLGVPQPERGVGF